MRRITFFCIVLIVTSIAIWPQTFQPVVEQMGEPFSFVGMTLTELITRFGVPESVYTARGDEEWQDDVVFVYDAGDFYIFRDRVWQIGITSVYGIRTGDLKAVALLILGDEARDMGDYILFRLHGSAWPLSLRVSIRDDRISAIYIYRPDF